MSSAYNFTKSSLRKSAQGNRSLVPVPEIVVNVPGVAVLKETSVSALMLIP